MLSLLGDTSCASLAEPSEFGTSSQFLQTNLCASSVLELNLEQSKYGELLNPDLHLGHFLPDSEGFLGTTTVSTCSISL